MKILLDTNILVHGYNKSSPHQKEAAVIIRRVMQGELHAYITPQVLYELFAVITNPKRVEKPVSAKEAADLCIDLWECNEIEKINPSGVAPIEVFRLAESLKLSKAKVFDCVLAVAAKEKDVDTIYTENVGDFKGYSFVKAVNPFEL